MARDPASSRHRRAWHDGLRSLRRHRRPGFDWRSRIEPAVTGILARPLRLALTGLGAALGLAALVTTLGMAQTAAAQVSSQFDAIAATAVVVQPGGDEAGQGGLPIPLDAATQVGQLNGVVVAGTFTPVTDPPAVRTVDVVDPSQPRQAPMPVVAASPGLIDAVLARLGTGRAFDVGHDARRDPVALVGREAAERLRIGRIDRQPTIFLGDRPFAVLGIVDHVARNEALLDAVIVPQTTALGLGMIDRPAQLVIRTEPGAAALVARQAPIALAPGAPERLTVGRAPSADELRDRVRGDIDTLFVLLGGVTLAAGGVGIANIMLLSVIERIGEIGLRRALGARRRDIAGQFLLESGLVGGLGGLVGGSIGVVAVLALATARGWSPVLDVRVALAAPVLGGAVGVLAGAFPAWRAARIEPIDALRQA